MKITVSGWPGAGASTLALLLAYHYNIKLYRGGEVFRYIYKQLDFQESGMDRVESHNLVEPHFGPLYDAYVDHILQRDDYDNILIESDITSFRLGKRGDIVSIFLKANEEIRKQRTQVDGRPADGEYLKEVDESHRNAYLELHNVDLYDTTEIDEKHQIVMDISNMTISEELENIQQFLIKQDFIAKSATFNMLEQEYWDKGKDYFKKILNERNIIPTPQEILKDITFHFPEEAENLPDFLRDIVIIRA